MYFEYFRNKIKKINLINFKLILVINYNKHYTKIFIFILGTTIQHCNVTRTINFRSSNGRSTARSSELVVGR